MTQRNLVRFLLLILHGTFWLPFLQNGLLEGQAVRSESSRAKVVCSDLTLHDVPTGIVGVPCPVSRVVLRRVDGTLINATRGWPSDGSFPVVLSPRKTKLISANPTLRWSPVKEAT